MSNDQLMSQLKQIYEQAEAQIATVIANTTTEELQQLLSSQNGLAIVESFATLSGLLADRANQCRLSDPQSMRRRIRHEFAYRFSAQ